MFLMFGCKNYNTIEVTFLKSNPKDTFSIKYNLFKLSNEDSVIFKNTVFQNIKVGEKLVFDSLPNGKYVLEYFDICGNQKQKKILLKNNNYESKIIFDSLPVKKYLNKIPLNTLENGNSYKIVNWSSCVRLESYYQITKLRDEYYLDSYGHKKRKLNEKELNAIRLFESELLALRNIGSCNSTGNTNYCIQKDNKMDTIIDRTCNWNGYNLLASELYNRN